MNELFLKNKSTGRSYRVLGPVYETPGVWCATAADPEWGECFVKILRCGADSADRQQRLRWAEQEAKTMLKAAKCTDRVPKLYDHWYDSGKMEYVLVMQKLQGQTLRQWMKEHPLKIDERAVFLRSLIVGQLARILCDIHAKLPGISHMDLKPENVLLHLDAERKWQVELIDFGTAAQIFSVGVGTPGYQAPEQTSLQNTIPGSGEAKDVFSLGIIWYELLTGKDAVDIRREFRASWDAPEWKARPSMPQQVLDTSRGKYHQRLFERMTAYDPEKRPTLAEVARGIPQGRKSR